MLPTPPVAPVTRTSVTFSPNSNSSLALIAKEQRSDVNPAVPKTIEFLFEIDFGTFIKYSLLTFTISDLSSVGDVHFHIPLLAVNTSAILGVAIDKSNNTLNLVLTYDHQMSSGKEALTFLIALKKKIIDLI